MITKKKIIYTNYAKTTFRFISIFCFFFLAIIVYFRFTTDLTPKIKTNSINMVEILLIFTYFITLVCFAITTFRPQWFNLLAFVAFIYSIWIITDIDGSYMGFLMYDLGIAIFAAQGFFRKGKITKMILFIIFFFVLILSHLRFGIENTLFVIKEYMGGTLVLFLICFFIHSGLEEKLVFIDKVLNLAEFEGLKESDCTILKMLLEGEKYTYIASTVGYTEGSIKNRISKILKILGIRNRLDFKNSFNGWIFIYKT